MTFLKFFSEEIIDIVLCDFDRITENQPSVNDNFRCSEKLFSVSEHKII